MQDIYSHIKVLILMVFQKGSDAEKKKAAPASGTAWYYDQVRYLLRLARLVSHPCLPAGHLS